MNRLPITHIQRSFFQGAFVSDSGTFQEFTVQPADILGKVRVGIEELESKGLLSGCKIPDSIGFDAAAALPVGVTTAAVSLYSYKGSDDIPVFTPPWLDGGEGRYTGKSIVVLGGSSSVGQYGKQKEFVFVIDTDLSQSVTVCEAIWFLTHSHHCIAQKRSTCQVARGDTRR